MPINIRKNAFNIKGGDAYFEVDMLEGDVNIISGYVSPEMFGAKGDGITDDTLAWQQAVDSGKNIYALSTIYKCGQIDVTKNITIDCNFADFVCTANTLFYCHGNVSATLTGQSDYNANDTEYAINSVQYGNYTGMAMLQGTNNFEQTRDYYRGGVVSTFHNGNLEGVYPIDIKNETDDTTILLIYPITITIKRFGNLEYIGSSNAQKNWIIIEYGLNCVIRDFKTKVDNFYTFIGLNKCLNCICECMQISGETGTVGTNSYLIGILDSSECIVRDSHLYNKYWHCITTGGIYMCWHNSIINCHLGNYTGAAFADHPNGIKSIIKDSVVSMIGIGGLGIVENCDAFSTTSSNAIIIYPSTSPLLTGTTIKDVRLYPKTVATIAIRSNPYVDDIAYYVDRIYVSNIKSNKITVVPTIKFNINDVIESRNASYIVGKIVITDVDALVDLNVDSPNVNRTNENIIVRND